jgi:hypothetical protein
MLLIHWSKHNKANLILQNGIKPSGKAFMNDTRMKGVWCFPYTRNKTLNTRWKSFLKKDRGNTTYNGFVFKLASTDFPIYAGDFGAIKSSPAARLFQTYKSFSDKYGHYFSPKTFAMDYKEKNGMDEIPDYFDFEIILPKLITASRIIKVIKDRDPI